MMKITHYTLFYAKRFIGIDLISIKLLLDIKSLIKELTNMLFPNNKAEKIANVY